MWGEKHVSVVLMTYAERYSIREVIEGFLATGCVDEVVVVNNNAEPGTSEEVARTPAREVFEPKQGYGNASRRGLREATGDLIVLAEPDGTFLPSDIQKLLVFSEECDAVFGTRSFGVGLRHFPTVPTASGNIPGVSSTASEIWTSSQCARWDSNPRPSA